MIKKYCYFFQIIIKFLLSRKSDSNCSIFVYLFKGTTHAYLQEISKTRN